MTDEITETRIADPMYGARRIHTLESHNAKLYQDNCRLIHTVNVLNDRLAFVGVPKDVQLLRLSDMQEKLRASEENSTLTNQKYQELLHAVSAGTAHQHFYSQLQAVREAYSSLDREYLLLTDKYLRLKAATDSTNVTQQHQASGLVPVVPSQFRGHDQTHNNSASPISIISPHPFQRASPRRRSSETVMTHPSLRSAPPLVPTTWLPPHPTPPPSASLPVGQMSSTKKTGFPVHASVPAESLPPPHQAPMAYDPRLTSSLSSIAQSRHPVEQSTTVQSKETVHPRQRCEDITKADHKELTPPVIQISTPAPLELSPYSSKRPSSELQTLTSPSGDRKKPRTEGEDDHSTTVNLDSCPANKILSLPASTVPHNNQKSSGSDSDVRSYQGCVYLIFEKDADVENGVFCGLCFDRHLAKMIPEPPEVLIQPDFDTLVKHCMTMHPTVWADLRHKA